MSKRKTKGRQRIEMKKMENEDQLHVTFSKRRNGLIKMANDMSVLTGSQIALVIFSPGGKVYPFGSPDVNHVIDRYANQTGESLSSTNNLLAQNCSAAEQQKLNAELSSLENEVVAMKKRGKLLDQLIEMRQKKNCNLETLIKELDLNQLEELLKSAKDLQKDVTKEIESLEMNQNAAPVPSIYNIFSSLGVDGSGSNGIGTSNNVAGEAGTAGVVQFAGPSRIKCASKRAPGAGSSKAKASLKSIAPGVDGADAPRDSKLGGKL